MAALATLEDYLEFTGKTLTSSQELQITALLDAAGERVLRVARREHGQELVQATRTQVLRPVAGWARFPQRPVTVVASVVVAGRTLTPDVDYRWTPGGDGQHAYLIRRCQGQDVEWASVVAYRWGHVPVTELAPELTVTYTAGLEPLPSDLVLGVVRMVRTSIDDDNREGASQSVTGPYQVTYRDSQGPDGVPGPMRSLIDDLCSAPGPTSVPIRAAL